MNEISTDFITYYFAHIILQIHKLSSMDYYFMAGIGGVFTDWTVTEYKTYFFSVSHEPILRGHWTSCVCWVAELSMWWADVTRNIIFTAQCLSLRNMTKYLSHNCRFLCMKTCMCSNVWTTEYLGSDYWWWADKREENLTHKACLHASGHMGFPIIFTAQYLARTTGFELT